METSRQVRWSAARFGAVGLLVIPGAGCGGCAAAPAEQGAAAANTVPSAETSSADEPKTLPQDGLFSSIKQSLREGDQEIIRGHFDLGSPPNVHRYYCLVDAKSRRREPNGVLGEPISRPDGMTGIKSSAVSLYRCEKAEQQGLLVTAGYLVPAHPGTSGAGAASAQPPAAAASVSTQAVPTAPPAVPPAAAPAALVTAGASV